jgi:hypothetical protein
MAFSLGFTVSLLVSEVMPTLAINSEQTARKRDVVFMFSAERVN